MFWELFSQWIQPRVDTETLRVLKFLEPYMKKLFAFTAAFIKRGLTGLPELV